MDGPLVWSNQHHQSGTLMPSGTVHTIFARSEADEAIQLSLCAALKLDCFVASAPRNDDYLPLDWCRIYCHIGSCR
jgi:hypothetical protein